MPMNQYNMMEHMQAEARKAQEAQMRANQHGGNAPGPDRGYGAAPQTPMPSAQPAPQAQPAPSEPAPAPTAEAQPAPQADPMNPMGTPAPQQEGPEDMIDAVKDGSMQQSTTPKPFVGTIKNARQAFADMLAGAGQNPGDDRIDPSVTTSVENNPNVIPSMPEEIAPGEGKMPEISASREEDVSKIIRDTLSEILGSGQAIPQPESEAESEPNVTAGPQDIVVPDINSDDFYEKFTENPGQAILDVAEALSEKKVRGLTDRLKPFLDESDRMNRQQKATDAIRQFAENGHDDFEDYRDDIINYLRDRQLATDDPTSYEHAYNHAKASRFDQMRNAPASLDDYFADPESVKKMAGNDQLKKMIIAEYLNGLNNGQSPQVISGGSSSSPNATGKNSINSIKQAGKMWQQMGN